MVDEVSGPGLDVGFGRVPVGADIDVPFERGKGAEVKTALPVVPDIPVENTELVSEGLTVVLVVGKGAWPELMIGGAGDCVPVPRLTLLPGGIPCPPGPPDDAVGPVLSVVFEIGNGAELRCVPVGPPVSPLLPVEAVVGNVPVATEPVTAGLVGFEVPVEFESGNGATVKLFCNGWVGLGPMVEFIPVKGADPVTVQPLGRTEEYRLEVKAVPERGAVGLAPPLGDTVVPSRLVEFDNG